MLFLLVERVFGKERTWTIIYDPLFQLIAHVKSSFILLRSFKIWCLLQMWFTDAPWTLQGIPLKHSKQVCAFTFAFNEVMVFDTHLYLQIHFRIQWRKKVNPVRVGKSKVKTSKDYYYRRKYYSLSFPLSNKILTHYFHLKKTATIELRQVLEAHKLTVLPIRHHYFFT